MKAWLRAVGRTAVPGALVLTALRRRTPPTARAGAVAALLALWSLVYVRYRRVGRARTRDEYNRLRAVSRDAFVRHYNERVPTIEEEFALWGPFHQHRHEMRYDLVAAEVRRRAPAPCTVLDIGCGAGLVADRLADVDGRYIGLDLPAHHVGLAAAKFAERHDRLRHVFLRGDAEHLPVADASVDVVVLSEVIEHLLRPELAVWEINRVLVDGGVLVMTTNNASEVPLRSPLSHPFAWIEKVLGFHRPRLISSRPWVWPDPVDPALVPGASRPVHLPHTHHIQAETAGMFAAAGLRTVAASTFEFPPPQARTTAVLERMGGGGRRVVDAIEAVATHLPLVDRLGCHLLMVAAKAGPPRSPAPPPGIWPGPFSP